MFVEFTRLTRVCLVFAMLLGIAGSLQAQDMHPRIRAMVDSMQIWMESQMQAQGRVDAEEMEAWNARIRAEQERIRQADKKTIAGQAEGARRIQKSGVAGSVFTVPEGKRWEIHRVTVSEGMGGYAVVVKSVQYKEVYEAGEQIRTPDFCAEAHLVADGEGDLSFVFQINESIVEE